MKRLLSMLNNDYLSLRDSSPTAETVSNQRNDQTDTKINSHRIIINLKTLSP